MKATATGKIITEPGGDNNCKIHDIYSLTMDKYVSIVHGNNLSHLIIAGNPTQEQLKEAFDALNLTFTDLISAPTDSHRFIERCKLQATLRMLDRVEVLLTLISICPSDGIAQELRESESSFRGLSFDHNSPEEYNRDLLSVGRFIKTKRIKTKQAIKSKFPDHEQPATGTEDIRKLIDYMLVQICDLKKRSIALSELTLSQFAIHWKDVITHIAATKRQPH